MDGEKMKQELDFLSDNDQHMASDGEGTKEDSNPKSTESENQQPPLTDAAEKSHPNNEVDICMEYGPKKRRIISSCSIFENREIIEKAMTKLAKEEDECGIFGRYVASVMRNLSSENLKKKLKKRIQHILLEIADEEEK